MDFKKLYNKYKIKYLKLKSIQFAGGPKDKLIKFDGQIYNSAGVLIINNDCFILGKSSKTVDGLNECDILGGGIDEKDSIIEETASRELFEESKMTFEIKPQTLSELRNNKSFISVPGRTLYGRREPGLFACFLFETDKYDKKYYENNLLELKKNKYPKYYYETIELVELPRVNVMDFFDKNGRPKKRDFIEDINGNKQYVTLLAQKCLFKFLNDKINIRFLNLSINEEKIISLKN